MGWEKRERGGSYYTRSRRVNGRVVREYVGGGVVGEAAAQLDEAERLRREVEAAAWKEERAQMEALDASVEELCEATEVLTRAALTAVGYHKHKGGEWRRRRER